MLRYHVQHTGAGISLQTVSLQVTAKHYTDYVTDMILSVVEVQNNGQHHIATNEGLATNKQHPSCNDCLEGRGKNLRTVLCHTLYHNCGQSWAHSYSWSGATVSFRLHSACRWFQPPLSSVVVILAASDPTYMAVHRRISCVSGGWKPLLEHSATRCHLSSNTDCFSELPQNLPFLPIIS